MMQKPNIYLVRLKPQPKLTPNHYGHRYFHSKTELKRWLRDYSDTVQDISIAKWEEIDENDW